MSKQFDTSRFDDYVDVASRMAAFFKDHPDGRLRPLDPAQPYRIEQITGARQDDRGNWVQVTQTFIVYTAAAFRTADDPNPAVGMAYLPFPGTTPYTRASELMNAETSAWGRALAAMGYLARKSVATSDEITYTEVEQRSAGIGQDHGYGHGHPYDQSRAAPNLAPYDQRQGWQQRAPMTGTPHAHPAQHQAPPPQTYPPPGQYAGSRVPAMVGTPYPDGGEAGDRMAQAPPAPDHPGPPGSSPFYSCGCEKRQFAIRGGHYAPNCDRIAAQQQAAQPDPTPPSGQDAGQQTGQVTQ